MVSHFGQSSVVRGANAGGSVDRESLTSYRPESQRFSPKPTVICRLSWPTGACPHSHTRSILNHSQVGPGTAEVARRYTSFAFLHGSSCPGRPTWMRNLTPSKKPRREPDCGYLRATSTSTPGPRSTAHRRGQRPVDAKSACRELADAGTGNEKGTGPA
jgi:hypothetical protein